ncbi:hypothetical protein [Geosporobacter ferrireducens]|uniref:Type II secretion system protein GspF domain-containing protein n=1 Tax=Geosporobacter ferrireducens TaxID=1424294 RepID=A0A1D8GBU1_9FIRM|nr:hypothetical protein [Geosporobacter ferrireducens]AOT68350.1 hypothetical protein Gferi_01320 [Geosporobacter ferrireducens]
MKYFTLAAVILILIDVFKRMFKYKDEIRESIHQIEHCRLTKWVTPNKESDAYKREEKLLERARVKISVEALQLIKLTGFFIALVIGILLVWSQYQLELKEIFDKKSINFSIVGEQTQTAYDDAMLNQLTREAHEKINYKAYVKGGEYSLLQQEVVELVTQKEMDREYTMYYAEKVYYNLIELSNKQKISYMRIALPLILAALGMLLPKTILRIRAKKTEQLMNIELNKLEILTLLLLKKENINIYQILLQLKRKSKVFNPYLTRCVNIYPKNARLALETMQKEVEHKEFSRFINILKLGIETNKRSTAEILEIARRLKNSIQQAQTKEKIDKKNRRILLIRFPMIIAAIELLLLPMIIIFYENM